MPGSYCSSVDGSVTEEEVASSADASCMVFLLDGNATQIPVQKKMKAAELIETLHSHKDVDVDEKDFFSLFYYDTATPKPQKIFLDPKKRVKDQVPTCMKRDWRLHYGVKFYVSNSSYMKEDRSRYLLCMQLCKDIKENRVLIDRETASRLTALMLQASLGDYDESEHQPGYTKELNDFILLPQQELPDDYEDQLVDIHKAKAGLSPAQAENEFLEVAQNLPRYGMHLFSAQMTPAEGSKNVLVGLSYRGIALWEDGADHEMKIYPWERIVTVEYSRKKVFIYYRNEPRKGERHLRLLHCGAPPQAKKIWKCAVEQHTFFRLHRSKPDSNFEKVLEIIDGTKHHGPTLKKVEETSNEKRRVEPKLTRSHSERLSRPKFGEYAPGYVKQRSSFRNTINRWEPLKAPPVTDDIDGQTTEEQSVQVTMIDVNDDRNRGSTLVLNRGGTPIMWSASEVDGDQEQEYRLKEIDPEAATTTTKVSVVLDSRPMKVAVKKSTNGAPIYDSTQIPDVQLNCADDVTTTRKLYTPENEIAATGELQKTDTY